MKLVGCTVDTIERINRGKSNTIMCWSKVFRGQSVEVTFILFKCHRQGFMQAVLLISDFWTKKGAVGSAKDS